jgi:hypothetical protein
VLQAARPAAVPQPEPVTSRGTDTMSIPRAPPQPRDRQRDARCSRCRRARERESTASPGPAPPTLNDANSRFHAQKE